MAAAAPADALIEHYAAEAFAEAIEASIRALGITAPTMSADDLEAIDEFHMGGRPATRALFEALTLPTGAHVLDVGSGIGGPARVGAAYYGWQVDGVDLTPAFVSVATDLSRRTGLNAATRFVVGSALHLPFADATFDAAYMLHVGMNIQDKAAAMREVARVLRPGARFGIYDIMRIGDGDLAYPLPWSSIAATSAVATSAAYRDALRVAGFDLISERDRRPDLRAFAAAIRFPDAPTVLPHRGEGWQLKTANLARHIKAGTLAPIELIAERS